MKKIVFDTNAWLNLIENFESEFLEILWDKINKQEIIFIIPENVSLEFKKKVKNIRDKTINDEQFSSTEVDSIISGVEQILDKSEQLKANSEGIVEWINSKTAPNHNATNFEDTAILNTLLTLEKGSTFFFVSRDSDFRINKNCYELHPDIRDKFDEKSININFYIDFKKLFAKENLFIKTSSQTSNELYDWKVIKLSVSSKNIYEKLKSSIDYYFKELDFIPLSYLCNIYPFNNNSGNETYFRNDMLVTNNSELYDFFEQSLIISDTKKTKINHSYFNSKKEINEYEKILNILNQNLVFKVQYERKKININFEKSTNKNCTCYECTFNRFDVKALINKIISDEDNSPKQMLKKAFYYYKSNKLYECLEIIQKILTTVKKTEYPIIHSIAEYNRDILRKTWFSGDARFSEERDKLKPKSEKTLLKQGLLSITGYIIYTKYFDYKFYDLIEDFENVKKRRVTHQGLGSSFNSDVENKNILRWAEFYNFISKNSIFFEYYSNTAKFAMYTFDLCLHAMKDNIVKYKLPQYIICMTMPYIKLNDYEKMLTNLGVEKLNYDKKINKYLFSFFESKINNLKENLEVSSTDFIEQHIKEIMKVVYLQSYLSLSKKQDEKIINDLIILIESENDITKKLTSSLKYLTQRKLERFNEKTAQKSITIILNSEIEFDIDLTSLFTLCKKFKIKLPDKHFNAFLVDNIYELTSFFKAFVFLNLYKIGSEKQKQEVLKKVHQTLKNIQTFDQRLYYYFIYENIFPLNDLYLNNFRQKLEVTIPKNKENFFGKTYEKKIKRIELLDDFINHISLYYYKDKQQFLSPFLNHSNYYNFLINPNSINKTDIEIEWFYIAYNNSPYAIKRILDNNSVVNKYFTKEISNSRNEKYCRAFLDIQNLKINQL
ncbi:hypothetical protein IMCC3317_11360 [Kordia antarctica]|uniref:DUF4935 domain-containing protein n=1 Tax=Kordia antarctica TaxID=1218801 RepID=A0A7L4ZGB1_9FLAO|nr:hypothetical protein [Kordia antarctica]QHI35788.1 hypothetical protein IMCC3317_11360 [Kordia antarctica]